MTHKVNMHYPGVRGKIVEFAEHNFADGRLHIRVRFRDKTELCWRIDSGVILRRADLSDWKSGSYKHIRTFVTDEI